MTSQIGKFGNLRENNMHTYMHTYIRGVLLMTQKMTGMHAYIHKRGAVNDSKNHRNIKEYY